MNTKNQLIGAWCGIGFAVFLGIGWCLLAGFLPPHPPTWTGNEINDFYNANLIRIRIGLLIFLWASALYIPFAATLTVQMKRIEGSASIWTYSQLIAGIGNVITLTFPTIFWAVAAFRPDRSPELIQVANDLAWVPFVGMTSPFLIVPIAIAIVGFMDKSTTPIFPRWACYTNLFINFLLLPGGLIIFFKSGPFAWNGMFGIWIPLILWGIWFMIMSVLLMRGIKRQALSSS